MTGWWKETLAEFAKKRFPGWVEASYALLSVDFEKQKEFEKKVREIVREVRHKWHTKHNDTVIMANGSKAHRTVILATAIKNKNREESRHLVATRMSNAAGEHEAQRVLGLCVSATTKIHPYLTASFWCPQLEEVGESVGAIRLEARPSTSATSS